MQSVEMTQQPEYPNVVIVCCDADFGALTLLEKWASLTVLVGDLLWILALCFFLWEGWRRSYSFVPGLAVVVNLSWSLVYAAQDLKDELDASVPIYVIFAILDIALFLLYLRHGRSQLKWPEDTGKWFRQVAVAACVLAYVGQQTFRVFLEQATLLFDWGNVTVVCSGYMANLIAILSFVFYFLKFPVRARNSLRGAGLMAVAITLISCANLVLIFTTMTPQQIQQLYPWLWWLIFLFVVTTAIAIAYVAFVFSTRRGSDTEELVEPR